jgi:hypothetical protein
MSDTFENPYPAEYGYYRIGTPINADLNRAAPACPAFRMSALAAENCLLTDVNPVSVKRIQGGGCDTKSQDAWGFSADSSVKLGFFVNASLSCHVSRSRNTSSSTSTQTLTAFAKQESGIELRKNVPDNVLLQCATPDFRDHVLAIRKAALALKAKPGRDHEQALVRAYKAFYAIYGTGFVSKLRLGAIGVFRGSAIYENSADETKANYGGGVSVSGVYGGFSAAAEYSSKHLNTNAKGSFQAEAFGMPAGSPVATWAEGFLNQFAEQQLAKLGDLKAWQECFDAKVAEAEPPVIKEKEPKTEKGPSFSAGDIEDQIRDLKLNEFADAWRKQHGGHEPKAEQYDEWIHNLKKTASEVGVADVARAQLDLQDESAAAHEASKAAPAAKSERAVSLKSTLLRAAPGLVFLVAPQATVATDLATPDAPDAAPPAPAADVTGPVPTLQPADAGVHPAYLQAESFGPSAAEGSADDVNFGGYGVVGYEYTPWVSVFPELKPLTQALTTSQVSMGLAMAWLSIRETLAQYLKFCAKFFPDVAPEGTGAAANAMRLAIDDVGDAIVESFRGPHSNMVTLPQIERRFRQALAARRFAMMRHYDVLIDNVQWLLRVPFGAVPLADMFDRYYWQPYETPIEADKVVYRHGSIAKTDFPAASLLEKGALRLYPILHEKFTGEISFFWTNVELVKLAGKEYRVGASILNEPRKDLPGQLDWGLFRILGTLGSPGLLASQASTPDVRPALKPGAAVWNLGAAGTPKCRLYTKAPPIKPATEIAGFLPGQYEVDLDRRLGVGSATIAPPYRVEFFDYRGERAKVDFDVCLAPVDYADARIAEAPAGGFKGGGPMWMEPRTDAIIEALNALGQ